MMFLYLIRLKMDQKGHIINQKTLKMYEKMPKIDTLDALEEHEEHEDDYQTNSN